MDSKNKEPYKLDQHWMLNKKMLNEYFIDKVHLSGVSNSRSNNRRYYDYQLGRWALHFRITLECRPKPEEKPKSEEKPKPEEKPELEEKPRAESGSRKRGLLHFRKSESKSEARNKTKAGKEQLAKGKVSGAQDKEKRKVLEDPPKQPKPEFIVIDYEVHPEDVAENNGKLDVPVKT